MNNKFRVLVVEEENNMASFIMTILKMNKYDVIRAKNGSETMMMITSYCPDIVLLDMRLPDTDGITILKSIRKWSLIPVIMVTEIDSEKEKISAFDSGADDYITKPFSTGEFLARIRTELRHSLNCKSENEKLQSGLFKSGGLIIDYDKRRIFVDGENVHMTQTEYNIVALLSKYAGRVLTYDYLIKSVWGPAITGDNQILRVNMANIRKKIEKNSNEPAYIFTENGVGYRMAENFIHNS